MEDSGIINDGLVKTYYKDNVSKALSTVSIMRQVNNKYLLLLLPLLLAQKFWLSLLLVVIVV